VHTQTNHGEIEDEEITSTQNMIIDSRARRDQNGKEDKCKNCDFKTKSVTLLKQHMKISHQNKTTTSKRIHCNQCDKKFNKESTFEAHVKKDHKGVFDTFPNENENIIQRKSKANISNRYKENSTSQETTRTLRSMKSVDSALDL